MRGPLGTDGALSCDAGLAPSWQRLRGLLWRTPDCGLRMLRRLLGYPRSTKFGTMSSKITLDWSRFGQSGPNWIEIEQRGRGPNPGQSWPTLGDIPPGRRSVELEHSRLASAKRCPKSGQVFPNLGQHRPRTHKSGRYRATILRTRAKRSPNIAHMLPRSSQRCPKSGQIGRMDLVQDGFAQEAATIGDFSCQRSKGRREVPSTYQPCPGLGKAANRNPARTSIYAWGLLATLVTHDR